MRILPMSHLAVEVPWHDIGWEGRICRSPAENTWCTALPEIRRRKDVAGEVAQAGMPVSAVLTPPCAGAMFMSPEPGSLTVRHPLEDQPAFAHLQPTRIERPAWGLLARPSWLKRREAEAALSSLGLPWRPALEPEGSAWVEAVIHQLMLGDSFFSAVRPGGSLILLYTRKSPLSLRGAPVLIGVGRVVTVGAPTVYERSASGEWEGQIPWRAVGHSIRHGGRTGFVFPCQRLLELCMEDPSIPMEELHCPIPEELLTDLCGESGLLDHARALPLLAAAAACWERIRRWFPDVGGAELEWLAQEQDRLRRLPSQLPGLAAALSALGIRPGLAIQAALEGGADAPPDEEQSESEDRGASWERFTAALRQPELLGASARLISPGWAHVWDVLSPDRQALLALLARLPLRADQVRAVWTRRGGPDDAALVADPWLLAAVPGGPGLRLLDRALMGEPGADPADRRRVRAVVVAALEAAAREGHTLLPVSEIHARATAAGLIAPTAEAVVAACDGLELRLLPGDPEAGLLVQTAAQAEAGDWIRRFIRQRGLRRHDEAAVVPRAIRPRPVLSLLRGGQEQGPEGAVPEGANRWPDEAPAREPAREPAPAAKPGRSDRAMTDPRLGPTGSEARRARRGQRPPAAGASWEERLSEALEHPAEAAPDMEHRARREKVAALEELAGARLSVLVAPRQTGGGTLLRALAAGLGGVVLVVPNAGLLAEARREVPGEHLTVEDVYRAVDRENWKNVVILHATQYGERELAKLLSAVRRADRIVLAGDPAMPLPAGAGQPFAELAAAWAPAPEQFPRVAAGYAELTVRCGRADWLRVADWFSGRPLPAGAAAARDVPERFGVRFLQYRDVGELSRRMEEAIRVSLELEGSEEAQEARFCASLSGQGRARRWQILAPTRGGPAGVDDLNRRVQAMFRARTIQQMQRRRDPGSAGSPGGSWPLGPEGILPGDRVVVTRGGRRVDAGWLEALPEAPSEGAAVARVLADRRREERQRPPVPALSVGERGVAREGNLRVEVQFPAHPGARYHFTGAEFDGHPAEPAQGPLSLAYALSVRWGQELRHDLIFLVLPEQPALWQREMIYAAITATEGRVYIFHPGPAEALFEVSGGVRRFSSLLGGGIGTAEPVQAGGDGSVELRRLLEEREIEAIWRPQLEGPDGSLRWPTAIFEDGAGRRIYWEHFGPPRSEADGHARAEVEAWYAESGVLPESEVPWGGENGLLVLSDTGGDLRRRLNKLLTQ